MFKKLLMVGTILTAAAAATVAIFVYWKQIMTLVVSTKELAEKILKQVALREDDKTSDYLDI